MEDQISSLQLRQAISDILLEKQSFIDDFRVRHDEALRETYRLLNRRKDQSGFPTIDEDEIVTEDLMEGYEAWREDYRLEAGPSNIAKLEIPPIPDPAAPETTTDFPIEPPSAPAAEITPSRGEVRARPPSPSRSHPSPPQPTAALRDIAPRRKILSDHAALPLHIPEWIPQDNYNPAETPTVSVSKTLIPLETPYISTLPRLPAAPSNGNKRRKKNSKDDNKDLHHLQVEYQLNPLSGSLAKSTKCVLTADWRVAQSELRHIRAMERIQEKEKNGRWSLRQPKKLRHPPIPKSHWDYLLEEAEWMRTDFAEERRWKIVEAREFAYQCVEWHLAKPDEKASLMVGGRGWGACNGVPIPGRTAVAMSAEDDVEMLVQVDGEDSPAAARATNLDATGAQVLDEIMPEKEQEEGAVKKEAENDDADAEGEDAEGEVDAEADAEGEADADGEEDAEGEDAEGDTGEDIGEGVIGLDDIPSGSPSDKRERTSVEPRVLPSGALLHKRFTNVDELLNARRPLLSETFETGIINVATVLPPSTTEEPTPPPSLTDLFPELAVYSGPAVPEEGKVHKRLDEGQTSSLRVAHTSRIMDIRPVLLSQLQPSKNAFHGTWDLTDGLWFEDPKGSTDVSQDVIAATSSVFGHRGRRSFNPKHASVVAAPQSAARNQHVWTDEENELLHRLVQTYPYHWQLISDTFNSEVINVPTDKLSAFDCYDRWYWKWGEGRNKPRPDPITDTAANAAGPSAAPGAAQAGTATPGQASAAGTPAPGSTNQTPAPGATKVGQTPQSGTAPISVPTLPNQPGTEAQPDGAPPPPGLSKREARQAGKHKYEGTKKSVRHQVLYDSMRRLVRRRDQTKLKGHIKDQPKKVIHVHESHSGYLMNQVNSPFDLVEAKWQRDMKDARDRQARQQQMQEARALALRQQQQAAMLNAQQAQQGGQAMRPPGQLAQPGQPGPPGAPGAGQPRMGPNGQPIPNMAPSQQQLLTAVAAANAARQQGQAPNAGGNVPRPQNGGAGTPGVPQGAQNPQVQQQMQMLQAQQLAARQAQAQAQQGQTGVRVPSGGTPHAQPRNLSGSPYSHAQGELPVGQGQGDHGSPVVNTNMQVGQQSSPNQQAGVGRVASGPMNQGQIPQHLRVPSGGNGSPQMNNAMPQGGQMQQPQINQALMQSMINTLQANGQQATPETIRALHLTMMRNAQAQAQAQALAQAQAQAQVANQGTPQAMQNQPPPFNRSPSLQGQQGQ